MRNQQLRLSGCVAVSKEQGKSKRWYKNWRVYLFLLIILLIIASLWVMSIGGSVSPRLENIYDNAKEELRNAVNDYQNQNNGTLPTINGTVTINGSAYEIINICSLLASQGGTLKYLPDSCISINGSDNDNCDAGCTGCWEYSHYIWAVDDEGNVYSTCVGKYCNASGVDRYQDVWP